MKNNSYNTKSRQAILQCLKDNEGKHLTVENLAEMLSIQGEKPSITTIYRTLEIFVKNGDVNKFVFDNDKSAYYEFIPDSSKSVRHGKEEYVHLKCFRCGKIDHLRCNLISELASHVKEKHSFSVDNSKTIFYGKCSDCSITEKN